MVKRGLSEKEENRTFYIVYRQTFLRIGMLKHSIKVPSCNGIEYEIECEKAVTRMDHSLFFKIFDFLHTR